MSGARPMVTSVRDPHVDGWFPLAAGDGYDLKSPEDPDYNCIAWAASITDVKWWPTIWPAPGVDWPAGLQPDDSLQGFMAAYATLRYEDCGMDGSLERGYEKIAIYSHPVTGKPTHAARQLSDGAWTSKLGDYRDIHHSSPVALEIPPGVPPRNDDYGAVVRYMRRKRMPGDVCLRAPGMPDIAPPYQDASWIVKLGRWVHETILAPLFRL